MSLLYAVIAFRPPRGGACPGFVLASMRSAVKGTIIPCVDSNVPSARLTIPKVICMTPEKLRISSPGLVFDPGPMPWAAANAIDATVSAPIVNNLRKFNLLPPVIIRRLFVIPNFDGGSGPRFCYAMEVGSSMHEECSQAWPSRT